MARHPRVMLKLGAFYALGKKRPPYRDMLPLIRRLVDAFGPDRCMWESDAPLQTRNGHTFEAAVAVIRDHADFLSVLGQAANPGRNGREAVLPARSAGVNLRPGKLGTGDHRSPHPGRTAVAVGDRGL